MGKPRNMFFSAVLALGIIAVAAVPAAAVTVADVGVTVSGSPAVVSPPGGNVTYTVVVSLDGAPAPVDLTNTSSGGGRLVSASAPAGCTVPPANTLNPTIQCDFTLLDGDTRTLIVTIKTASSPGEQKNRATVGIDPSAAHQVFDDNDSNDSREVTTPVRGSSDLAVTVDAPEAASTGDTVAQTVTLTNNGPDATAATLSSSSTGASFVAGSSSLPADCSAPLDGAADPSVSCSFTTLASGASVSLTVALTGGPGSYTTTATTAVGANSVDPVAGNNSASDSTTVSTNADLAVTVSGNPVKVSPAGGGVIYTITATNTGPSPTAATLTDVSTGGGKFMAAFSEIPGNCSAPADQTVDPTVTCDLTLAPGASQTLEVAIKTAPVVGTQKNTASIAGAAGTNDGNSGNDTATVETPVLNDGSTSTAFVPSGGTLSFLLHVLTASGTPNGVIPTLKQAQAAGALCGTSLCDNGLTVDFDPNPDYQGVVTVRINFGKGNPCRGKGAASGCADLYLRKNGVVTKLQMCSVAPQDAVACIEAVDKSGANLVWTVRLKTTDPDFLPPLPSPSGSR